MKGLMSRRIVLFLVVVMVLIGGVYLIRKNSKPEMLTGVTYRKPVYAGIGKQDHKISNTQYNYIGVPDGFIVLRSTIDDNLSVSNTPFVLKMDAKGTEAWRYQFPAHKGLELNAQQMPNGDVIVSGDTWYHPQGQSFIMRFSKLGKPVWIQNMHADALSILDVSNKRILVYQETNDVGKIALYDSSGMLLFQQPLDKVRLEESIEQIIRSHHFSDFDAASLSAKIYNASQPTDYGVYNHGYGTAPIDGKYYSVHIRAEAANRATVFLTRLDDHKKIDILPVKGYKGLTHSFEAQFVGSAGSLAWFTVDADAAVDASNSTQRNNWDDHNWSALYVTDGHTARKLVELGRAYNAFDYEVGFTKRSDGSYILYTKRADRGDICSFNAYNAAGVLLGKYQLPDSITSIDMHPSLNLIVAEKPDSLDYPQTYTTSLPTVACPTVKLSQAQSSQQVVMECATPEANIYYTTDGTPPARNSTRYTSPVKLDRSAKLKACAFKKGLLPSVCRTFTETAQ